MNVDVDTTNFAIYIKYSALHYAPIKTLCEELTQLQKNSFNKNKLIICYVIILLKAEF